MRIKKTIKFKNYKLLKLKLLESEILNKNIYLNDVKIEHIEQRLKKILHVIYKFHVLNKKILFVGAPFFISYKLYKLIKKPHLILPDKIWERGAISKKGICAIHLSKRPKTKLTEFVSNIFFRPTKPIDLILILENSQHYSEIIREGAKSKIPIISIKNINSNNDIFQKKSTYNVFGNFKFNKNQIKDKFLFYLILSTLKKGNKARSIYIKRQKMWKKIEKNRKNHTNFWKNHKK